MTDEAIYQKVLEFATNAHDKRALKPENRFRKSGIPYITHPVAVKDIAIEKARRYFPYSPIFLISLVALLHDVLEDTTVTPVELQLFLGELFPLDEVNLVLESVILLTKDKNNFDVIVYLSKIRVNILASIVKISDLEHNMSDLKPGNLLDKYKLCHYFLTQ